MLSEPISSQKTLTETELRMVAEVAIEMARAVAGPFSAQTGALTLARAALKDTAFKTALVTLHRNILVRRAKDPYYMLAPLAPLFCQLEQEAKRVLSAQAP